MYMCKMIEEDVKHIIPIFNIRGWHRVYELNIKRINDESSGNKLDTLHVEFVLLHKKPPTYLPIF